MQRVASQDARLGVASTSADNGDRQRRSVAGIGSGCTVAAPGDVAHQRLGVAEGAPHVGDSLGQRAFADHDVGQTRRISSSFETLAGRRRAEQHNERLAAQRRRLRVVGQQLAAARSSTKPPSCSGRVLPAAPQAARLRPACRRGPILHAC